MWSTTERTAIDALEADGFNSVDARILTALISRRYAREILKLVDVLTAHNGLEDPRSVRHSIDGLLRRNLIAGVFVQGQTLLSVASDYEVRLSQLNASSSATALADLQSLSVDRLEIVGQMTEPQVLETFRTAAAGAQHKIRLPFFTSLADIEGIDAVEDRARAGVKIEILLASPKIIAELRGPSATARAERAIRSWQQRTADWPNTEVRLASSVSDIEFGSSMSIDGTLLRLDLHDPLSERSLLGQMICVRPTAGNLIRLFDSYFDSAWARAVRTSRRGRLLQSVLAFRWTVLAVVTLVAALINEGNLKEILAGIAVTCLFAAIDENSNRLRDAWRKLRGAA